MPDQPAKIAVFVKRFPRLSETFILNEFLELQRRGLPVELFAIMDPGEARSQPEAQALVPEVTYLQPRRILGLLPRAARAARRHPWGALRAAGWVLTRHSRAAARNYLLALTLVSHLEERGFGHLHAHFMHSPAAIAFVANKISCIPYSVAAHAKDIYTTLPENVEMRSRRAVFVSTCTEANRQHLIRQTGLEPDRVVLCRHGVDLERFGQLARAPHDGRILAIGRLVPKKGFEVLLRAGALLLDRGHGLELRVIGSGPLRDQLEAEAHALGIEEHVRFRSGRPQPELLEELSAATIFALAPVVQPDGDRDGLPNVILEAMAAGLPVVASAVSGIPEMVEHDRTGWLVPPADPESLADGLERLLDDEELRGRLGDAARAFALANLSIPRSVEPLAARLNELSANGRPR